MTKELRKKIMLRLKLKNKFNKERDHINWSNYKRQRNHCLSILRKTKKEYFNSLNIKQVSNQYQISSSGKVSNHFLMTKDLMFQK